MSEEIVIKYLVKGTSGPIEITIPDAEYYDVLNEGESYKTDGVAKYQDPHLYVGERPEDLEWLVLSEPLEYKYKKFRYQYLQGLDSFMVHTQWPNGDQEIIHSISITEEQTLIARSSKEYGKSWATVASGIDHSKNKYESFTGGKDYYQLLKFQEVE